MREFIQDKRRFDLEKMSNHRIMMSYLQVYIFLLAKFIWKK